MMKVRFKNKKGITLIILIFTIVILTMIAGIVISNMDLGIDIRNYNYMCADIELLESKVITYYNQNNSLPITGQPFNAKSVLQDEATSRDNNNYYKIDLSLLNNITLNYGGGTAENQDIYIINEDSFEIYYLNGAKYEDTVYHKPIN